MFATGYLERKGGIMEITLEKIELVRDRTGVSYKDAKDALEAAGGSVVDAIIAIENTIDMRPRGRGMESGMDMIEQAKEILAPVLSVVEAWAKPTAKYQIKITQRYR